MYQRKTVAVVVPAYNEQTLITDNVIKLIGTVGFLCIALAVMVARNSPATAYESSIYTSTPPLVWGCLMLSVAFGIGIIIHQAYFTKKGTRLWVIGFTLLLLSNTVFLSLYIIRGYYLWGVHGDLGLHIGWINDIIASGHIERQNVYPIMHIYVAELSQVLGVEVLWLSKLLPVVFAVIYMIFILYLAKYLMPHQEQVLIASVSGMALLHGWFILLGPNVMANLLFPFVLYVFVRSSIANNIEWKILFVIIIFLYPPFHPVPSFVLLLILLTLWIPNKFISLMKKPSKRLQVDFRFNIGTTVLLLIWSVTWLSSFYVWDATINNTYSLITEGGSSYMSSLVAGVSYAEKYGVNTFIYILKLYSGIILYGILSLLAFPLLLKKHSPDASYQRLISLYGPMVCIFVAMLLLYFIALPFGPGRIEMFIIVLFFFPAGYTLSEFIKWAIARSERLGKAIAFLVAFLIFAISVNGAMYIYSSSYAILPSLQNTRAEIVGMDWFIHAKEKTLSSIGWYYAPSAYAAFLLTANERSERNDLSPYNTGVFPLRLGYDQSSMLGRFYSRDVYLVMREQVRRVYIDVYPWMAPIRLLQDDFVSLEDDSSVDKLYSNRGLDVYFVHALK